MPQAAKRMLQESSNRLREFLTSSRMGRMEIVKLKNRDGEEISVGVVQGSLELKQAIGGVLAKGSKNQGEQDKQIRSRVVIECAVNPETGERLFDECDQEALTTLPCGWVNQISEIAIKMLSPPTAAKCEKCGTDVALGARFCASCGEKLPGPLEVATKNS